MNDPKFIIYASRDEVIVTTPELERQMRENYGFHSGDRDEDTYDRMDGIDNAVCVKPSLHIDA